MVVCALAGRSKGRTWYWCALLGLLSLLGLLIANGLPARRRSADNRECPGDPTIRLIVQSASASCQRLGEIQVEVKDIADIPKQFAIEAPIHEFDLSFAAETLSSRAAALGANAVEHVSFLRVMPNYWSLKPTHRIIAHGTAVSMSPEEHAQTASNAVIFWRDKEAQDPERELHGYLARSGVTTLLLSCINLSSLLADVHHLADLSPLDFFVCWMIADGILLLTRRTSNMLRVDGWSMMALGTLRFVYGQGHYSPINNVAICISGLWSLECYRKYGQYLAIYQTIRRQVAQMQSKITPVGH